MIRSADEFFRLRTSKVPEEYDRAYREEAPEAVWLEVIERYPELRYWVALNKTSPLSILGLLVDDKDVTVRKSVAGRRRLDYSLFDKLSNDVDETVRGEIAYNKKAPREILEKLTQDDTEWVAEAARRMLARRCAPEDQSPRTPPTNAI